MTAAAAVYTHGDEPFVHQALVYGSDQEFLDTAGAFLREGLAAGEVATAVTTRHNIGLLRDLVGDSEAIRYIDADSWYLTPGATLGAYFRSVRAHLSPGRLRVIGEPVWTGRSALEIVEWKRYESVINAAFDGERTWILCPYDTRVLPSSIVSDAARTHPEVVSAAGTWISLAYREPAEFSAACDLEPLPAAVEPVSAGITPGGLQAVREFVAARARERGVSERRLPHLLVAVNELATNVVVHGGGSGVVRLWQDGTALVCDVIDFGGGLRAPHPGQLCPPPDAPGGHGLWVARQLCDLMQVRVDGGKSIVRVHMVVDRQPT
jgi:anti-sigma regulatory factor (Ser/Thr protein kinase)